MATEEPDSKQQNLMLELLERVRDDYKEEHGEDPPEEFVEKARREIILQAAKQDRDDHRDIYEKLADE